MGLTNSTTSASSVDEKLMSFVKLIRRSNNLTEIEEQVFADPHLVRKMDKFGNTALHLAIYHKVPIKKLQLLIELGAILRSNDHELKSELTQTIMSESPLHWAVYYRSDAQIIELLIKSGSKLTETDSDGETALQLALRKNYVLIAATIIKNCQSVEECECLLLSDKITAYTENLNPQDKLEIKNLIQAQISRCRRTIFSLFLNGYSILREAAYANYINESQQGPKFLQEASSKILGDKILCTYLLEKYL
jgi:ankyrin repeat protein